MMFAEPFALLSIMVGPPADVEAVRFRQALLGAVRPVAVAFVARGRTGIVNAALRSPTRNAPILYAEAAPFALKPQPMPLPRAGVGQAPAEVVRLQRQYRRLMELGLHEEAAEVASRLTGRRIVLATFATPEPTPARHQVGYRGNGREFVAQDPTPYAEAKSQTITAEFRGDALDAALGRLHRDTGVTVRIALADDDRPKVFALGADLSLARTLDLICGSCGCTWTVRGGEVLVERPTVTVLRDAGLPIRR